VASGPGEKRVWSPECFAGETVIRFRMAARLYSFVAHVAGPPRSANPEADAEQPQQSRASFQFDVTTAIATMVYGFPGCILFDIVHSLS